MPAIRSKLPSIGFQGTQVCCTGSEHSTCHSSGSSEVTCGTMSAGPCLLRRWGFIMVSSLQHLHIGVVVHLAGLSEPAEAQKDQLWASMDFAATSSLPSACAVSWLTASGKQTDSRCQAVFSHGQCFSRLSAGHCRLSSKEGRIGLLERAILHCMKPGASVLSEQPGIPAFPNLQRWLSGAVRDLTWITGLSSNVFGGSLDLCGWMCGAVRDLA